MAKKIKPFKIWNKFEIDPIMHKGYNADASESQNESIALGRAICDYNAKLIFQRNINEKNIVSLEQVEAIKLFLRRIEEYIAKNIDRRKNKTNQHCFISNNKHQSNRLHKKRNHMTFGILKMEAIKKYNNENIHNNRIMLKHKNFNNPICIKKSKDDYVRILLRYNFGTCKTQFLYSLKLKKSGMFDEKIMQTPQSACKNKKTCNDIILSHKNIFQKNTQSPENAKNNYDQNLFYDYCNPLNQTQESLSINFFDFNYGYSKKSNHINFSEKYKKMSKDQPKYPKFQAHCVNAETIQEKSSNKDFLMYSENESSDLSSPIKKISSFSLDSKFKITPLNLNFNPTTKPSNEVRKDVYKKNPESFARVEATINFSSSSIFEDDRFYFSDNRNNKQNYTRDQEKNILTSTSNTFEKIKSGSHWSNTNLFNKSNLKSHSEPTCKKYFQGEFYGSFKYKNDNSGVRHTLPHIGCGKSDSFMRIDCHILHNLLTNNDSKLSYTILDCRYDYEYLGGHIIGALNKSKSSDIIEFYHRQKQTGKTDILIFHCEFSQKRAPYLANLLRTIDRNNNIYPNLDFPEVYILDGGYKGFFNSYRNLCTPVNYVPMTAPSHRTELLRYNKRFKY
ncbi:hypothetical protein EDEG_03235 [Edhazardia aedis USNM 41457]|uniref:M-phase inducer phosphatase n=1 Tax=Edhazardia aedis (strain USNM 41457) TaxID=1003232 RepID=J8ZRL0_EDHAE|nr:hypothetical protein EDEG_03235 [Edhazardia aedis USNM 41457]|eukprot:EJW02333.1 hypothetical protein EDEG_03235 [Edhazardia aedis USNM 41457]